MRVTKVKVKIGGKQQSVEIFRTPEEGALILKDRNKENRSKEILESKKDSFLLSIKNQTVYKPHRRMSIEEQKLNKLLTSFVSDLSRNKFISHHLKKLKDVSPDKICDCLKDKFTHPITYVDDKDQSHTFTFSEDLNHYIQKEDKKFLENYQSWVKWYIKNKTHWIVKSIEHNKIALEGDEKTSKRRSALEAWEDSYHQHIFNLNDFHERYHLDELVTTMQALREGVSEEDQTSKAYKFHQSIKEALQKHQKKIFGTRETYKEGHPDYEMYKKNREDAQLATYHLEMVKYIAHYFPLKSSKRKNSINQVNYYFEKSTIQGALQNQLLNALRLYIIQKKKAEIQHWKDISIDSDKLSAFKRRDFFMLKLFNYVAFATNNVRNIVDREQEKDILGKVDLKKSLKKNHLNLQLLEDFFQVAPENRNEKILWALRGAVQQIRNEITHYDLKDKGTLGSVTVFDHEGFEFDSEEDRKEKNPMTKNKFHKGQAKNLKQQGKNEGISFASVNYFRNAFANEIQTIPTYFKEMFSSNQIIAFYSCDNLRTLFEKCCFYLHRIPVAHAPGFKKIRKLGAHYQHAESGGKTEFYDLELEHYVDKNELIQVFNENKLADEAYQAHYFLLKLIYNHAFLNSFLMEDKNAFREASDFVLETSERYAKRNQRNQKSYAFYGFRTMDREELPSDYLKEMQSAAVQEQIKKEKAEQKGGKEGQMNYEKYIQQIFLKGFDTYLKKHELSFITSPHQVKDTEGEEGVLDEFIHQGTIQHALKCDNSQQLGVFIFCKLLDASMLSDLRNELIKLRETNPKEYEKRHQFKYNFVLEIIELCLLSADRAATTTDIDVVAKKNFFETDTTPHTWDDLYKQTDNVTNVAHANIQLVYKYGTLDLLKEITSKYPINHNEYLEWKQMKESIAEQTERRAKIHAYWVKGKDVDSEKYKQLCLAIEHYNWLDNKLHLVHIRRLHELMLEILSRMASYVALWDRDVFSYRDRKNKKKKRQLEKGKDVVYYKDEKGVYLNEIKESPLYKVRCYIAHFNYISSGASQSILELLAGLRNLMDYDRKLKNAVAKSLITIFEKHGMVLNLNLDKANHTYTVAEVKAKSIEHLKSKKKKSSEDRVFIPQVSEEYCKLCQALLEYNNQK